MYGYESDQTKYKEEVYAVLKKASELAPDYFYLYLFWKDIAKMHFKD